MLNALLPALLCSVFCPLQLFTQVEAFSSAISKLQELGLSVNVEESELVYRGTAGGCMRHQVLRMRLTCLVTTDS
jgi:hypothetical protein